MYKVFIENRVVIFTQALPVAEGTFISPRGERSFNKWLKPLVLRQKENGVLYVVCDDLEKDMEMFFKNHKAISAAGGIVSKENEILFIFRNGLWDLPKGKIEKGEKIEHCAIREVEEECGIKNVRIVKLLTDTFHTYEIKGKKYIKRTYWYQMNYSGSGKVYPQKEEGITDVKWFELSKLSTVLKKTYPSIREVVELYLNEVER